MDVEHYFDQFEDSDDSDVKKKRMALLIRKKRKRKIAAVAAAAAVAVAVAEHAMQKRKAFTVIGRSINVKRQRDAVTKEILLLAEEDPKLTYN
jgi:hypothetical protein